jgi:glutamyl-tRNA reductase
MSVLVVGLSHKGASLATLERVALTGDALDKLLHDVASADDVASALVLSTCNRVEIYAEVDKFHGAVAAICELLSRHSQVPPAELTPCLYVQYEDRAVQHLLAVACGLDSMVVGESQILGQLRQALQVARARGTLGRTLSDLGSLALRTGKRTHTETRVGTAGASLVTVGLEAAARHFGAPVDGAVPLAGRRVVVVGAGSMSGLAAASVTRAGAAKLTVVNRTRQRAERLAASAGGQASDLSRLTDLMAAADLVVTCTGATGHVISIDMVRAAVSRRGETGRPLVLLDLAMPRDVDPLVARIPGVALTDLEALAADGQAALRPADAEVAEVRRIMAEELATHMSAHRAAAVAPTVVALRAKAASVVEAELGRLAGRLGRLDPAAMAEVAKSMRRVTDKLLHDPTVRIKELAGAPGADTYEDALRVLFDLDPATVQAVAQADADLAGWPQATTDQEGGR